jgi:hypothetical protein
MEYWINEEIPIEIFQETFISDITDDFGTRIFDDAWNGQRNSTDFQADAWRAQVTPTIYDWELCRKYLTMYITQRGL